MTKKNHKIEVQENQASQPNEILQGLETDLSELINDESTGLSDLRTFTQNLTHKKSEKKLTEKNLAILKSNLQNGGLVDFEGGSRDGKVFGFEVIGNDIEPTLTPNGDCLIPINFRYDSQRRTKLLILHIEDDNGENVYTVPDGANKYLIEIGKESREYYLDRDERGFHVLLKK